MSWKDKLTKGIEDVKTKVEASKQKNNRLKDIEEQAYYAAKEKQAAKVGAARANIETSARIKSFKSGGGGSSSLGGFSFNPGGSLLGSANMGGSLLYGPQDKPKRHRRHHKKAKYKMVRVRV